MSNKRITDLTELTTPTTDDVFPVVDIATNTTTKVQLGNLPVPTSVTTALATKQDTLVSGTNIKTVNSTSLVGSGNVAVQETLVSGTNIKTINSTSLLGSGNITIAANPSGVAGAIQFSNGSAFASDAANLFWDDTNNRLGVGTNAPASQQEIKGNGNQLWITNSGDIYTYLKFSAQGGFASMIFGDGNGTVNYLNNYATGAWASNKFAFGPSLFTPNGQVHIKGSGSTSATTSLLVQNSTAVESMSFTDAGVLTVANPTNIGVPRIKSGNSGFNGDYDQLRLYDANGLCAVVTNGGISFGGGGGYSIMTFSVNTYLSLSTNDSQVFMNAQGTSFGKGSGAATSSIVEITSTTKGFLPPRMTTTQKNAIATPAAGLVVYDSTTNKLCCYNGSTWNDLF